MPPVAFFAVLEITGINPYVRVSAARAGAIKPGWRKPLPVLARINGEPETKPWRVNMMPMGNGDFYLYLHGEVRRTSKTQVGDKIRVEIEFDANYRNGPMHPMPSWFRTPLFKNEKAKKSWDALPPSRKKEILRYFATLKSPEVKTRNAAKAVDALSGKKIRFMARSW